MATSTLVLGSFADGKCRLEMDYDDKTLHVSAIRAVNDSDQAAAGRVAVAGDARTSYTGAFTAKSTVAVTIPTTTASARIALTRTASGKLDGMECAFQWPT